MQGHPHLGIYQGLDCSIWTGGNRTRTLYRYIYLYRLILQYFSTSSQDDFEQAKQHFGSALYYPQERSYPLEKASVRYGRWPRLFVRQDGEPSPVLVFSG